MATKFPGEASPSAAIANKEKQQGALKKLLAAKLANKKAKMDMQRDMKRRLDGHKTRSVFLESWAAPRVETWDGVEVAASDSGAAEAPDWLLHQMLTREEEPKPLCFCSSRTMEEKPMYRCHRALGISWERRTELPEGALERATLRRVIWSAAPGEAAGGGACRWAAFHVYRIVVDPKHGVPMSEELCAAASRLPALSEGLSVSNIGGWHSGRELFREGHRDLQRLINGVIQAAEADAAEAAGRAERRFSDNLAAWVNVSHASDYNRIHDHQGGAWSGCYYAQDGGASRGAAHSGRLLLKPTPGPLEAVYSHSLSTEEIADLEDGDALPGEPLPQYAVDAAGVAGVGEYALIDPLPGSVVLFPSWLLHAVLPILQEGMPCPACTAPGGGAVPTGLPGAARVSCAFNAQTAPGG